MLAAASAAKQFAARLCAVSAPGSTLRIIRAVHEHSNVPALAKVAQTRDNVSLLVEALVDPARDL